MLHYCGTLLCCSTCWSLQTLLHCCGITNIVVPAIIAILYICAGPYENIVTLCLPGFMNIYTIYLHEHQYGLLNIIFHEIMTVAAWLECYNKLS